MTLDRTLRGWALPAGRILRSVCSGTLVVAALAADASAQAPARPPKTATEGARPVLAELPSARSILDRHLAAIGGRAAVLSHSSTVARGTLSVPKAGMTGTLEMYAAAPNRSLLRITITGVGDVTEGFDGTHGWSHSPMTGPMLLDGKQLEERKFDSEFYRELGSEPRYASMTTLQQTEFEGRACYKIRLERKDGGEDFEFYDVATGLKAGSIMKRETQMGTVTSTTVEGDYRKFGNLLQATTIKSRVGEVEQVGTITSVEYDSVPASMFELPAAIKALIK